VVQRVAVWSRLGKETKKLPKPRYLSSVMTRCVNLPGRNNVSSGPTVSQRALCNLQNVERSKAARAFTISRSTSSSPALAAFLRIPHQPKLSASYTVIASIRVIAMRVGKSALRAHDKRHQFLIGHWPAGMGEEIEFAQRSKVDRVLQPSFPEVEICDGDSKQIPFG
jgi:hypothetical protein